MEHCCRDAWGHVLNGELLQSTRGTWRHILNGALLQSFTGMCAAWSIAAGLHGDVCCTELPGPEEAELQEHVQIMLSPKVSQQHRALLTAAPGCTLPSVAALQYSLDPLGFLSGALGMGTSPCLPVIQLQGSALSAIPTPHPLEEQHREHVGQTKAGPALPGCYRDRATADTGCCSGMGNSRAPTTAPRHDCRLISSHHSAPCRADATAPYEGPRPTLDNWEQLSFYGPVVAAGIGCAWHTLQLFQVSPRFSCSQFRFLWPLLPGCAPAPSLHLSPIGTALWWAPGQACAQC